LGDHIQAFKEELLKNPNILSCTNASRMFSTGIPGTGYLFNKKTGIDPTSCQFVMVDYDFLNTFQIELRKGRFFSREFPSDNDAVLVNEAAIAAFHTDDPIGKEIVSLDARDKGHAYRIIGVINNFNYESLHTQVRPLVLHLGLTGERTATERAVTARANVSNVLSVRVARDAMPNTLDFIADRWKALVHDNPFNYNFVDATLARLYVAENKTNTASIVFSSVAIFIACIGLFGLAAFVTEQRTKEIGIRKVLGASSKQVVLLFSKEFAGWVLVSNLIAWPVAWYVMRGWLSDFAFRTEISINWFFVAGAVTFVVAFLTVGYHALRASFANPIESLRRE
jgi:putative ABC transport system permease protein